MSAPRFPSLAYAFVVVALFPTYRAHGDAPAADDDAACKAGDGAACFRLGERASAAHNAAATLDYYSRACNAGRGLACVHLGRGVEPDEKKRPGWEKKGLAAFSKACAAQEAESCYFLGIAHEQGSGTKRDQGKALAAYHKACTMGSLPACTNEAGQYLTGKGTKKDTGHAATLYTSGCERGDSYACYWLGHIHDQELKTAQDQAHVQKVPLGKDVQVHVLDATTPPRASATASGPAVAGLFTESADKPRAGCKSGHALDCYKLGVMLQVGGPGVPKDDTAAVGAYEKACAAGSGWGCLRAGDSYQRGYGVKADFAKASHYYLKVCEEGVGGKEGYVGECRGIIERMGL